MFIWRPEEGFGAPGTGVTGRCELSDVGDGIKSWVLWKGSMCSVVNTEPALQLLNV